MTAVLPQRRNGRATDSLENAFIESLLNDYPWYENGQTWYERQLDYLEEEMES